MSDHILTVNTLRARYFAYNCLELKLPGGKTLVVDPCLIKEGKFSCGYDASALEGADYVFCNHSHEDHVASLGEVYDRFHSLILANAAVSYQLAKLYDIPYVRFVPFVTGDEYDFDDFKINIIHGRHNNYVPGQFMVRPSGRRDELCPPGGFKLEYDDPVAQDLAWKGSMFGSNFLMTTKNNLRVGLFAGNPGMTDPQDRNTWKNLRPDIIFAHREKFTNDYANKMADILEITGARILVPIHIEDAYRGTYDPAEYVANVNRECERRGLVGRMLFMEHGQWYEFSTGVTKL